MTLYVGQLEEHAIRLREKNEHRSVALLTASSFFRDVLYIFRSRKNITNINHVSTQKDIFFPPNKLLNKARNRGSEYMVNLGYLYEDVTAFGWPVNNTYNRSNAALCITSNSIRSGY